MIEYANIIINVVVVVLTILGGFAVHLSKKKDELITAMSNDIIKLKSDLRVMKAIQDERERKNSEFKKLNNPIQRPYTHHGTSACYVNKECRCLICIKGHKHRIKRIKAINRIKKARHLR